MLPKNTSLIHSLSRRNALKFGLTALMTGFGARFLLMPSVAQAAEATGQSSTQKILIASFSRTGNTRTVAECIHNRVGGDLFDVRATHAYPDDYRATTEQARRELDDRFRPDLTAQVADMNTYTTVFIGYPNWWGTMPMAMFTFLESYSFAGKTLIPFCTHEGSRLGRGPADIARLCPDATLLEGFSVRGGSAASAQESVTTWLTKLKLA